MAEPNYGGEALTPATQTAPAQAPTLRRARRQATARTVGGPFLPAINLLKEADDELMRAQAMLVTCRGAILSADGAPDPHSLASVIESAIGVVAGAVSRIEDSRALCERGAA